MSCELSLLVGSDQDLAAAAAAAASRSPLEWLEHRLAHEKQQFLLQPRVPLKPPGSLISQHRQLLPQNTWPLWSSLQASAKPGSGWREKKKSQEKQEAETPKGL